MANQARGRRDPLDFISIVFGLVWLLFALFARPVGDYGVETDFYGDLEWARRWYAEGPTLMNGFRGPLYHLVLGALAALLRDGFLAGKLISAVSAAAGLRILGGLVRNLFGSDAGLGAVLFLAAAPLFIGHTFRAGTDMFFWALFAGTLALLFRPGERPVRRWVLAGAVAGAAWLTRTNGLLLVPIAVGAAAVAVRPRSRAPRALAGFGATMLVVASPWLAFVSARTGNPFWSNTFKLFAASVYGPSPGLAQQGELAGSVGFASASEVLRLDPGRVLAFLPAQAWDHLRGDVTGLVGWPLAVTALLGLAAGLRSRAWTGRRSAAFWLSGAVAFAGMLPVFYNPRFMLPLLIWWAAAAGGLLRAARRGPRRAGGLILLLGLIGWNSFAVVRGALDPLQPGSPPLELVELARVVEGEGLPVGPDTPIAARKPHVGHLLHAPVIPIPAGGTDELRNAGAHYLLVSALEANAYPLLAPLLRLEDPAQSPPGLRLVAGVMEPVGGGRARAAKLYAVRDPVPWSPPPETSPVTAPTTEPGLDRMDTLRLRLARWYLRWTPEPEGVREAAAVLRLMDPDARRHPSVLVLEGDAALMSHDAVAAVGLYRRALAADPDRPGIYLRVVGARLLSEPGLSARELLRHPAAGLDAVLRDSTASWWTVAAPHFLSGDYAASIAPLKACTEAAPANGDCHRYLGLSLMALGWYDSATAAFRRCLELSPEDVTAREALDALEHVHNRRPR